MLAEPFLSRFAPANTRHTTGIERPWCVESLPSHISKMVVSTVSGGGPEWTVDGTVFEMWLGAL